MHKELKEIICNINGKTYRILPVINDLGLFIANVLDEDNRSVLDQLPPLEIIQGFRYNDNYENSPDFRDLIEEIKKGLEKI